MTVGNDLHEAVAFLRSSSTSAEKPADLRKHVEPALSGLLDEFYAELLKTPAAGLFPDAQRLQATRSTQQKHWESLFADTVAPETIAMSEAIGRLHLQVGLPAVWYVAAYGWIMKKMIPMITRHYGFRRGDLDAVLATLVERLFVDMAASISAYEEASVKKAVGDVKAANRDNLGKLAQAVAESNGVILQLAFLQRNSNAVAINGQTISSAAAELVASVEEIARNSESAANEAGEANQSASSGRAAIETMSGTIANIAAAVDETSRSVDELAEASDQIGQILSVIEGIAAQTNLLALNATIESARAGEAGKGFAVVAAEVKNLANQTARSTEDIAQRIAALREGMAMIQKTMQTSNDAVAEGEAAISEASGQMGLIVEQIGSVCHRMMEISGILGQQKGASSEIALSIGSVADTAAESDQLVQKVSRNMHASTAHFSQHARDMFDGESDISLCFMAKIDHVLFKQRVIDTCMGTDSWKSSEVPDHHACRLGKWYDGISSEAMRRLPAFAALVEPHKVVHASAKAALDAAAAGDADATTQHLHDLDEASIQVLAILDELATSLVENEAKARRVA